MSLSIGKLAKASDVKVPTIRFYEQIGLLPEAERSRATHGSTGPMCLSGFALFARPRFGLSAGSRPRGRGAQGGAIGGKNHLG